MDLWLKVFEVILPVILVVSVGFLFGKFTSTNMKPVNLILLYLATPCLIFTSLIGDNIKLNEILNIVYIGGTIVLIGVPIIYLVLRTINKDPKIFCDELSETFRSLTKTLNLSNDDFIRTTEERHHKSVIEIWNKLLASGDIYQDKYSGWYSVSDEAFYDEDEIEDKNGKKRSKSSGSLVEWVEEESYFFKLSAWSNKLLEFYKKNPNFILPESRKNEVVRFEIGRAQV